MSQSQQQFDMNSEQSRQQEMIQSSLKENQDEEINWGIHENIFIVIIKSVLYLFICIY